MKATILRRRGGLRLKSKAAGGRGFMCGCGGSKAVSVISDGSSDNQHLSPMATPPTTNSSTATTASTATTTTATKSKTAASTLSTAAAAPSSSFSPSSSTDDASASSTPSVAALLRQLGELEQTVRSLTLHQGAGPGGRPRHRRSASEGRVEAESVAVVKESADPLADFRRSMLQMIVEKEIVGGDELRGLLHCFLSLNSPCHHHLILRAFAEIWEELFSCAGHQLQRRRTTDFLLADDRKKKNKAKHAQPTIYTGR